MTEDLFHAFFWRPANVWNRDQHTQIFTIWAVLRQFAQEVDHLPRVARFRSLQFAAKAATGLRRAALVAKMQNFYLASELCEYAQNKTDQFPDTIDRIMADIRIARRR